MATSGSGGHGVLFDVDGTLVDNDYVHVVAWWQAFRERRYEVRMSDIHAAIGKGSDELVEAVCGRSDPAVSAAHSRYYAPYLGQVQPFPKVPELLRRTAAAGLTVVLASSVKSDEVDDLLEVIGAAEVISAVASSGDVRRTKPEPDPVHAALDKGGLHPSRAVMVGDTLWDVQAARRAGVSCVGVRTGGWPDERLRDAGAVEVYDDAAALLDAFDRGPLGRLERDAAGG